jgi:hypothetical protein
MAKQSSRSKRARREEYQARQRRQRTIFLGLGAVGVVLLVALFVVIRQSNIPSVEEIQLPEDISPPPNADGKAWGPENAPVLIQEYSDFQ